ncbi:unnamed protein product [Adineta ricciae]|uniref:G-protein coupled receptors family 1 profile domain-containing protein n=1 Tax=Adineta ricciae TaxID=249248 RepID=A0A816AY48_ADIRI|nr:unnamed protein product [Adineta ricciae]CAF1604153.1 unnamed protein product [Adineta ricciae]
MGIIIYHIVCKNLKQEDRVVSCVCLTIYPVIFLFTIIAVSFHIQTLLGDLYGKTFNSASCTPIGYISYILLNMFYWAFINQALFRLCRISYSRYQYLQSFWFYISLSLIELVFSIIVLSPLLFWHAIVYLTEDFYCYVKFTHTRGILWLAFGIYGIPLSVLSLIYLRIVIFLRRQPKNLAVIVQQKQQRDLVVFQRILVTIGILVILGIAPIIFLIMAQITGEDYFLAFRLIWPFISLTMIGSSLALLLFTPQLKHMILEILHRTQIVPFDSAAVNSVEQQRVTTRV